MLLLNQHPSVLVHEVIQRELHKAIVQRYVPCWRTALRSKTNKARLFWFARFRQFVAGNGLDAFADSMKDAVGDRRGDTHQRDFF